MADTIYIVTGVLGHLGNTIAKMLLSQGKTVRGLALETDTANPFGDDDNITIYRGNVCDKSSMEPLFCNTNGEKLVVIHTAGVISINSQVTVGLREVNIWGTQNVIDLCCKHCVSKLIYISSVHAIPEKPLNETITEVKVFSANKVVGGYAKTKAEATRRVLLAARNGLNAVVVHPSGIIGPGTYGKPNLTQLFIDYLSGSLTACIQGGYDFVDVRDVAQGTLLAIEKGKSGECYILSGEKHTIKELLDVFSGISNKKPIKFIIPMWFAKFTAPASEYYYKLKKQPPLYTKYSLNNFRSNCNFSNNKAKNLLGYQPRGLDITLQDTYNWLIDNSN